MGRLVAALFTVTAAGTAQAQAAPAWGVSASVLHRTLEERADDGSRLVEETGPLLRLAIDGQMPLRGGGALEAKAALTGGELDYDGRTQAGAPLATRSRHRDVLFGVGWRPLPAAAWGEGWLVLQVLQQQRDIASTATVTGLRETSLLVLPGVRWSHGFAAGGWRLQPSVELRASVHHQVDIDFHGVFDEADIRGGRRWEAELALQASAPDSPWSWGLAWTHARQSASARQGISSGGVAAGTVVHPRIRIDDVALRVRRAF